MQRITTNQLTEEQVMNKTLTYLVGRIFQIHESIEALVKHQYVVETSVNGIIDEYEALVKHQYTIQASVNNRIDEVLTASAVGVEVTLDDLCNRINAIEEQLGL